MVVSLFFIKQFCSSSLLFAGMLHHDGLPMNEQWLKGSFCSLLLLLFDRSVKLTLVQMGLEMRQFILRYKPVGINLQISVKMSITIPIQQVDEMVFFIPASDYREITSLRRVFHIEIFSVWMSRRQVQKLRRTKNAKCTQANSVF